MDQARAQRDVLICPVSATPAFTHRPSGTAIEIDGRQVPYLLASGAYTMRFALTGHPVFVVPDWENTERAIDWHTDYWKALARDGIAGDCPRDRPDRR